MPRLGFFVMVILIVRSGCHGSPYPIPQCFKYLLCIALKSHLITETEMTTCKASYMKNVKECKKLQMIVCLHEEVLLLRVFSSNNTHVDSSFAGGLY